jgi:autotransporter-associated beta strand protein
MSLVAPSRIGKILRLMQKPLNLQSYRCFVSAVLLTASAWSPVGALTVTDYASAVSDRFSTGYPAAPVPNVEPEFIGLDLDWRGVGWAASDATKSFAMLSPAHYLVARHYGGAAEVRLFADGVLLTEAQAGTENIGLGVVLPEQTMGDLALGTLLSPFPTALLPRYAVLDLNSGSTDNTPSAYNNLSLLLYGRGPNGSSSTRIGLATSNSVSASGNSHQITTSRTAVQLEGGDSGSPAFHPWLNPDGARELAAVGNHAAISSTSNFINFLGSHQVMTALSNRLSAGGYALRVVGTPTNTWQGVSSTSINSRTAWGLGPPRSAPSDKFVTFDASVAGSDRLVTVNSNHNLRGLYFKSTHAANDGFSFEGSSNLSIGRGGITNYDNSRQTFLAPLVLGHSQFWNSGAGGITAGTIETNGKLLEISGPATTRITGGLSGNGALAVSGGRVELTAASTYTGNTYVWNGTLSLATPSLGDESMVLIGDGGTLELDFSGSDSIAQLVINGDVMPPGLYGSPDAGNGVIGIRSITGSGRLLVSGAEISAYGFWAIAQGLELGINDDPAQDPDGDGVINMLEFVLGGDPLVSSPGCLPQASLSEDNFIFTFSRRRESIAEVALAFQWGTDLAEWPHEIEIGAQSSGPDLLGVAITVTAGLEGTDLDSVTITVPRSNAADGKCFGRLGATFAD